MKSFWGIVCVCSALAGVGGCSSSEATQRPPVPLRVTAHKPDTSGVAPRFVSANWLDDVRTCMGVQIKDPTAKCGGDVTTEDVMTIRKHMAPLYGLWRHVDQNQFEPIFQKAFADLQADIGPVAVVRQ